MLCRFVQATISNKRGNKYQFCKSLYLQVKVSVMTVPLNSLETDCLSIVIVLTDGVDNFPAELHAIFMVHDQLKSFQKPD